jgi:cell wall-associated NlpC family hydrolase
MRSIHRLALGVMIVLGLGGLGLSAGAATPAQTSPVTAHDAQQATGDFWLASSSGGVWNFGDTQSYGSAANVPLAHPIVGITPTSDDAGYWLVASDGGIFAFGDAPFEGSTGAIALIKPIVGITPTNDDGGYWLVASDGGIFAFGDAPFYGSTGGIPLNKPIVGMVSTPDGHGYWLVASDGGIFSFGDAKFQGSTGAIHLNQPIISMTPTTDGLGYWLLASDGGVFTFGDAQFNGSTGSAPSADPAQKLVAGKDSLGYWIVDQNGTAHPFGDVTGAPPALGLLFRPVTPGDRAVLFAFAQLGKHYIWGGNGPVGYDCSGLALASWENAAGIGFARVANDQYHTAGQPVALSSLAAGDLVFWGSVQADWTSVYHTAIYVGGGEIVEATGDHVQLNSLGQWGQGDLMPMWRHP